MAYAVDGMDMRDVGSNSNFTAVNLSAVQEVEVLTGGWNAEYGQANGAIVNVTTRSATDRLHAIATTRVRPPGTYHWGRNIYGEADVFRGVMTTPAFWDPESTWQTEWMDEPLPGYDGGREPFKSMTPEQRAAYWAALVTDAAQFSQIDYADRVDLEQELTVYGPLARNLGFMVSGRYKRGAPVYPSALEHNPDMTVQGALDYAVTPSLKVEANGVFTRYVNSGVPRSNYQSSEETISFFTGQELPFVDDPYSRWRYWLYGNKGNSDPFTIRPPETAQLLNLQLKGTRFFGSTTFLEAAVQHNRMAYRLDYRDIARAADFESFGLPTREEDVTLPDGTVVPGYGIEPPTSFWRPRWGFPGDVWRNWVDTRSTTFKADLTSQVTEHHLVKAGAVHSAQFYDKVVHEGRLGSDQFAQVNDFTPTERRPFEGAFYVQDKIEYEGMVVNAGLRLDYFDANQTVSADIFDPLLLHGDNPGNTGGTGVVGFDPDGTGPAYARTPLRVALSPRLGVSHPITKSTVLHFSFGKFNQRPPWSKILANPFVWTNRVPEGLDSDFNLPDTTLVTYRFYGLKYGNPGLTWERMTQYEIGFEQNVAGRFALDVTVYSRDAQDLTSRGIRQGPADGVIQESGGNVDVQIFGDPTDPESRILGETISTFYTTVNGAWAKVRGIEATAGTRFPHVNAELNYTLSFLTTGSYHFSELYKEFGDGTRLGENVYEGASNLDDGGNGLDDDSWNPHATAILKLSAVSPDTFGPAALGLRPLGGWQLTTSTRWSEGSRYTYYAPDYSGVRLPDNQRWEDRWTTNLNLSKTVPLASGTMLNVFAQVTNVFNQKHLRLFGGDDLTNYTEEGVLPFHPVTREPEVWNWYVNRPRQAYFGVTLEL